MLGVSRIELVHQALGVRLDPALYSFARLHSEDFYPRRRNKPTAGGFAHELALVRSSIRPTYDYPVALCDDILHRCDEVREGRAVGDYTPAIVVGTLYREIQRVMADEFIRRESFDLKRHRCSSHPRKSDGRRLCCPLRSSLNSSLFPRWPTCSPAANPSNKRMTNSAGRARSKPDW